MLMFRGMLLLGLPVAAASGQSIAQPARPSQATVTETRSITVKNGGDPDTLLMRATNSGRRSRIDVTGPAARTGPWHEMGTTEIIIATDSTTTAIFIDSARKTYWTTDLRATMHAIQQSTTMNIKPVGARDASSLDSLGDGGRIAGYPTLHFRRRVAGQMTANLLGRTNTWDDSITTDYFVAPGLRPEPVEHGAGRKPVQPPGAVAGTLAGNLSEVAAASAAAMLRMQKIGRVVETITQSTVTTDGGKMTNVRIDQFVSERTIPASDSLFAIPAGYKKARPGFLPTT